MQIQSGWAKGIKLKSPSGLTTRPTSAKIRAAVFDMLRFRVELQSVLDLFSGSGAVGLESISQGATKVTFVDQSPAALKTLKDNLESLKVAGQKQGRSFQAIVTAKGVESYLSSAHHSEDYDLVWVDPPYAIVLEFLPDILNFCQKRLTEEGVFVLESSAKDQSGIEKINAGFTGLHLFKQKQYGETLISLYTRNRE